MSGRPIDIFNDFFGVASPRGEAHDGYRRQSRLRHRPRSPAILRGPQPAGRGPEGELLPASVDRESVPVYQVVGVTLRQAMAQDLEAATPVAGAGHDDFAVEGNALLILDCRDKPSGVRVAWMRGDGKAEF